jgi:UDP-N-acetylmuramoylalanine--D-glutamate ligase
MVWTDWVNKVRQKVKTVILFGDLGIQLEEYLITDGEPIDFQLNVRRVNTLDEAVSWASSIADVGDVVLLAPGGTSFDAFPDFSVRGERFRQLVNILSETRKRKQEI